MKNLDYPHLVSPSGVSPIGVSPNGVSANGGSPNFQGVSPKFFFLELFVSLKHKISKYQRGLVIGTSFHEILLITFIVLGLTKWGCSKFFITQMGVDQLFRAGYAHLVLGVSPIGGPV